MKWVKSSIPPLAVYWNSGPLPTLKTDFQFHLQVSSQFPKRLIFNISFDTVFLSCFLSMCLCLIVSSFFSLLVSHLPSSIWKKSGLFMMHWRKENSPKHSQGISSKSHDRGPHRVGLGWGKRGIWGDKGNWEYLLNFVLQVPHYTHPISSPRLALTDSFVDWASPFPVHWLKSKGQLRLLVLSCLEFTTSLFLKAGSNVV